MTAPDPRLDECANCLGCPDCGPVSSKRTVEAIAHRLDKVSEGPWIAWDRGIGYEIHGPHGEPVNDRHRETFSRGDAEFIAMAPGDVHFLLAELRKARERARRVAAVATRYRDERNEAREALARVEGVATDLATRGAAIEAKGYNGSIYSNRNEGRSIGYLEGARLIRAAVAAAKETE